MGTGRFKIAGMPAQGRSGRLRGTGMGLELRSIPMEDWMDFFDDPEHVAEYIRMADGYDGRELIAELRKWLPDGSTVLELGMGPGVDLDLLGRHYRAAGTDRSKVFVDLYREKHADADVFVLDAVELNTERTFDCIYSNKVLHHLTREELRRSLVNQAERVPPGGVLMHSFWHGTGEEIIEGLRFTYYTEDDLPGLLCPGLSIVQTQRYTEMEDGDSFYVILRKEGA
jgi:cyclopropane fatty-acyl-phospholipid synthase-like methyltransferase